MIVSEIVLDLACAWQRAVLNQSGSRRLDVDVQFKKRPVNLTHDCGTEWKWLCVWNGVTVQAFVWFNWDKSSLQPYVFPDSWTCSLWPSRSSESWQRFCWYWLCILTIWREMIKTLDGNSFFLLSLKKDVTVKFIEALFLLTETQKLSGQGIIMMGKWPVDENYQMFTETFSSSATSLP